MSKELYATAVGAWGDCIAAYGNACFWMDEKRVDKCNMICCVRDPDIIKFMEMQSRIDKVVHVKPPESEKEYLEFIHKTTWEGVDWNELAGVDGEIMRTHIHSDYLIDSRNSQSQWITRPKEMCAPVVDHVMPHSFAGDFALVFQPFSTSSVSPIDHWPFWFNALEWLCERQKREDKIRWHIWVIGEKKGGMRGAGFEFPNLSHLPVRGGPGFPESMLEVLTFVSQCKGMITTSNSLSMWSIVANIPSLVVCNKINMGHDYFNAWIDHPPNTLLGVNTTLDKFKREFEKWEETLE